MDESLKVSGKQAFQLDSGGQLLGLIDELSVGQFGQELEEAQTSDDEVEQKAKTAEPKKEAGPIEHGAKEEDLEAVIIQTPTPVAVEKLPEKSNEEFFEERQIPTKTRAKFKLEKTAITEEPRQEIAKAPIEDTEPPEEFHSITTSRPLSEGQVKTIQQKLDQINAATVPQEPVVEKISEPILAAIQISNPQLAEKITSPNSPYGWQKETKKLGTLKPKAVKRTFSQAKMEELKQKFAEQIRQQVKLQIRQGIKQMDVLLKPRYLGQMKIRLTVEDSAVIASFGVENQTTKELLQRSEFELSDALAEHNLELSDLSISLLDDNSTSSDSDGKQTASIEEMKTLRAWASSFRLTEKLEEIPEVSVEIEEGLNIVV